jgi:hypothetical protein
VKGKLGSGLWFDGDDRVQVAHNAKMNPTNKLSVGCWVWPGRITGTQYVINKGSSGGTTTNLTSIRLTNTGAIEFVIRIGGVDRVLTSTGTLSRGQWSQIMCTYDGSLGSQNQKIFINGVLDSNRDQTGNLDTNTNPLDIGGAGTTAGNFYVGAIDEVYYFTRALSAAEVTNVYNLTETAEPKPAISMHIRNNGNTADHIYIGAAWASMPLDCKALTMFKYNHAQIEATAENVPSQTKFANVVPNGILYGSVYDQALAAKDAAENEAKMLAARRGDLVERFIIVTNGDASLVEGKAVTIEREVAELMGRDAAFDVDCVEVEHNVSTADGETVFLTRITGNEHFPGDEAFVNSVARLVSAGRS